VTKARGALNARAPRAAAAARGALIACVTFSVIGLVAHHGMKDAITIIRASSRSSFRMGLAGSPRGASLYRPPSVWRTW
jgi:hypothetical protein